LAEKDPDAMITKKPSVSVVICAYTEDRWDQMVASVNSAARQSHPAEEIIVAIDHNPSLLDKVRSRFPGVVVVANSESPGLSGARNSGITVARGDIVAFLDDDAVAAPDWLERLCAGYRNAEVAGVGGSIEPDWHGNQSAWFPPEFGWVVGCSYEGMPRRISPIRNLIGANMSFRREFLVELGGFRSGMGRIGSYPAGCEETELCIRAHQRWPGSILLYDPAARVRHNISSGRTGAGYFRSRCYAEGLSKALVSRSVGAGDGLSSERAYVCGTLPRGVLDGVADVFRGDLFGLARAAAIVVGLAFTTMGYLVGLAKGRFRPVVPSDQLQVEPQG